MNKEKQRIAIAEACGIFICPGCLHEIDPLQCSCGDSLNHHPDGHSPVPMGCACLYDDDDAKSPTPNCPDYLNDLNAIHEAVKANPKVVKPMRFWLQTMCDEMTAHEATAAQRAEAFLRTIGKWVE